MSKWKLKGNTTRPGNKLWDEYVDEDGNSTLEIHQPVDIPLCKEHYYEYLDSNGNVGCRNCPIGTRIPLGFQTLKDGKIVEIER